MCSCPSSAWTTLRLVPSSMRWVEKLWRRMWGVSLLLTPRFLARATESTAYGLAADVTFAAVSFEEKFVWSVFSEVISKSVEKDLGEHHVAILRPLCLTDVNDHALRIDVGNL